MNSCPIFHPQKTGYVEKCFQNMVVHHTQGVVFFKKHRSPFFHYKSIESDSSEAGPGNLHFPKSPPGGACTASSLPEVWEHWAVEEDREDSAAEVVAKGLELVNAQDNPTKCYGNIYITLACIVRTPCHMSLCDLGKYLKVRLMVGAPQISDEWALLNPNVSKGDG